LLRALLTQSHLADHAPHGVRISGARINGDLDLRDAHVRAVEVWLDESWIAGDADLSNARLEGVLTLDSTLIEGRLSAGRAVVASDLRIRNAVFGGPVDLRQAHVGADFFADHATFGGPVGLRDAHVEGQMSMTGASVAEKQTFDAQRLHVGAGGLFLDNVTFGGPVDLRQAYVEGQMSMTDASVAEKQMFNAAGLHVGNFLAKHTTFGGPVDLLDAHVEGQMAMGGASVAEKQTFAAQRLHVGAGGLFLDNVTFDGPVDLRYALVEGLMTIEGASVAERQVFSGIGLHVGGDFFADYATFGGPFSGIRLHVGGDFFANHTTFRGAAYLSEVTVDRTLTLLDSHVRQLDLTGAVVRDDLLLGGRERGDDGFLSEYWLRWDVCEGPAPCLNLRNARVGNLQDDEQAWPNRITLEGFGYTHLGGIGGEQRQDMRNRPVEWWRDWLRRDPIYSAQPYAQLAGVLTAAGNRDGAADIRFFSRERERSELLLGCKWLQDLGLVEKPADQRPCTLSKWGNWLGLAALQVFVGYGIGNYTFRAVGWALALTLIGTVILLFAPGVRGVRPSPSAARRGPRQKSPLWCVGASLHRVLPLITISQEFSEFFNDPKREHLHAWQHVAFAVLALCGWALAGFVAAAFTGLTQG
jgi:hypothetical protein